MGLVPVCRPFDGQLLFQFLYDPTPTTTGGSTMTIDARTQRLVDKFQEGASFLGGGGFSIRHGIARVLRHLVATEGDPESCYAVPARTLGDLADSLEEPTVAESPAIARSRGISETRLAQELAGWLLEQYPDHPITPPPELVNQWCYEDGDEIQSSSRWYQIVATKAARWGADQELEACVEWLEKNCDSWWEIPASLRAFRRPKAKPPTLKEQALEALDQADRRLSESEWQQRSDTIRRALEALND